jgi:hypothetical protein
MCDERQEIHSRERDRSAADDRHAREERPSRNEPVIAVDDTEGRSEQEDAIARMQWEGGPITD